MGIDCNKVVLSFLEDCSGYFRMPVDSILFWFYQDVYNVPSDTLSVMLGRSAATSVKFVAARAQFFALTKKYIGESNSGRRNKAINNFLASNDHCSTVPNYGDLPLESRGMQILALARKFLLRWLCTSDQECLSLIYLDDAQFSGGSTQLSRSETLHDKMVECTHTYTSKFVRRVFYRSILSNPRLVACEKLRAKAFGSKKVTTSKLTTVDKTSETDRTIAIEPLLNMYAQQAVRKYLERRLARLGINLSNQQIVQQNLAQRGSVDGSIGTIDLSCASDTVSLNLCRYLLPPSVFDILMEVRTSGVRYNNREVELHMISTMGNATTFPLECLVFASIVAGVYQYNGYAPTDKKGRLTFGIFGDDIIVDNRLYNDVIEQLIFCGFIPNKDKSFGSGPFRESCGGDFFEGTNVRPVYVTTLDGRAALFSLFNRLSYWGAGNGFAVPHTLAYVKRSVRKPLYVPHYEDDCAGFKTDYFPFFNKKGRYRLIVSRKRKHRVSNDPDVQMSILLAVDVAQSTDGTVWTPCRSNKVEYEEIHRRYVNAYGRRTRPLLGNVLSEHEPVSRPGLADKVEVLTSFLFC